MCEVSLQEKELNLLRTVTSKSQVNLTMLSTHFGLFSERVENTHTLHVHNHYNIMHMSREDDTASLSSYHISVCYYVRWRAGANKEGRQEGR